MRARKITIRFSEDQWEWADQKRREAIKDFNSAAIVRYEEPKKPGGDHFFYITEKLV